MNRQSGFQLKNSSEKLVFLFDESSRIERGLLQEYVRENFQVADVSVLNLSFSSSKLAAQSAERLGGLLEEEGAFYLIPLRVTWWVKNSEVVSRMPSLKDILVGAGGARNSLTQRALLKGLLKQDGTSPYEIVVGAGASLTDLREQFAGQSRDIGFSRFIVRAALLALERAERTLKGARYKIPRLIEVEVLGRPQLRQALEDISAHTGQANKALQKEAAACLKEMAATPTPEGLDLVAALGRSMYTRGFEKQLDYLEADLERVRIMMEERPVAFVFTHKSHVDGFLLYALFHDMNLPPVHTFGGINMGFLGLGTMLRNAGAILIRRSFGDDHVYKAVFKNYIDYLASKRFPVNWALEGTRSRTGKLLPARFGLINYVVGSYLREGEPDLVILPISIVYDQIPEVYDYDSLQAGGIKRPESAAWFLEYIKGLNKRFGKIHIRFGNGVMVADYLDADMKTSVLDKSQLQKIAFDLAVDVNNVTLITLNSLICYALLEQGHRAVAQSQLLEELQRLRSFIEIYGFPATAEAGPIDPERLQLSLAQLESTGVIEIVRDGVDMLYMIPHGKARIGAYYRNGLIQFFITSAVGELALLAVSGSGERAIAEFHREALRIRDLMKYEFFFEGSQSFIELLESQFDARIGSWREMVRGGRASIRSMLQEMPILIGHGTLRPFIEAYQVFAKSLSMIPEEKQVDQGKLVKRCLAIGQQGVLQQRIHCEESVSRNYFENAVKVAEGRDLLSTGGHSESRRAALFLELQELATSCRFLASISDSRRYD